MVPGTTTTPPTNNLALIGFIAAFVIPIAGLVLGIVARKQLYRPDNTESGRGFARWAIFIGTMGALTQFCLFVAIISRFATAISNAPALG